MKLDLARQRSNANAPASIAEDGSNQFSVPSNIHGMPINSAKTNSSKAP